MVFLTRSLLMKFFRPRERPEAMTFLDTLNVIARSGNGGNGSKQYGGIGGRGGHVVLVGVEGGDLSKVKKQAKKNKECYFKATHGTCASRNQLVGPQGDDVKINVPLGLLARDKFGRVLGEINNQGEEVIIARGGTGGSPATDFTGLPGETNHVKLDLQLVADIGLLGFPNAGKSSLLKAISNAKPRIASYPFTTLRPKLGIMEYEDLRRITMADLPGLVEGAHKNQGMGHRFLRHLERTKLIILLVDITGFQLNIHLEPRTVLETIALLNKEVELFNPDILKKPTALVVNKIDLPEAPELLEHLKADLKDLQGSFAKLPEYMIPEFPFEFRDVSAISAIGGRPAVEQLKLRLREMLDEIYIEDENVAAEDEVRLEKLKRLVKQSGPVLG